MSGRQLAEGCEGRRPGVSPPRALVSYPPILMPSPSRMPAPSLRSAAGGWPT